MIVRVVYSVFEAEPNFMNGHEGQLPWTSIIGVSMKL